MTAINPTYTERMLCGFDGHQYVLLANGPESKWCERCGWQPHSRQYTATRAWNDYMDTHGPVAAEKVNMHITMFAYNGEYRKGL